MKKKAPRGNPEPWSSNKVAIATHASHEVMACACCNRFIAFFLHQLLPSRRDSVPYAALYIAPILIDTRLHSTRGQFFIRHECGACIRLRTNTSLIRMISRSAYGFSIFVITCLHTSDERVQTLYTSCIRIVSNPFSVLHT